MTPTDEFQATIVARLSAIEGKINRLLAQSGPKRPSDDEKVYRDPKEKYWAGDSYAGARMSECPPDYLRALAKYKSACAWANRKEGDPAKAKYADKDEATSKLALAWAEYHEASGTVTHSPAPSSRPASDDFGDTESNDSSVPF